MVNTKFQKQLFKPMTESSPQIIKILFNKVNYIICYLFNY